MKPTVYVETSVISYLTARDSRDVRELARQQWTRDWWQEERPHYTLLIGEPVLMEIVRGDVEARAKRQAEVKGLPVLPRTEAADRLADLLVETRLVPAVAYVDAYHISVASVHGVDFLMTWNCRHINNPHTQGRIVDTIRKAGFSPPAMTTPEFLWRRGT